MANRVTATQVKAIIETSLVDDDVTVFIATANNIVTNRLTDKGLDDATLEQIELWLSAHLVAIRNPLKRVEEVRDARQEFQYGKLGEGLRFTAYGQQALTLDTTGTLGTVGGISFYFQAYGGGTWEDN